MQLWQMDRPPQVCCLFPPLQRSRRGNELHASNSSHHRWPPSCSCCGWEHEPVLSAAPRTRSLACARYRLCLRLLAPAREHLIDAQRKLESACASQRSQLCCSVSCNLESAQRWRVLESFKLSISAQLQEQWLLLFHGIIP